MNRYDKLIALILNITGGFILLSIPAIFLPDEWMARIHQYLGLGTMPRGPIVSYLARSLSAMYAILGVFTVCFAWDVRRYAPPIAVWSVVHIVMGGTIFVIDIWSGMPAYWTALEGPPVAAIGPLILWLQSASDRHSTGAAKT
jgi:hypothetical protein